MKTYVVIYDKIKDEWALHPLINNKPADNPVCTNDESLYELIEEAKEYGIPREAIIGKMKR